MIVAGALLALMILASTLFVVDQRQFAVLYQFGEIKEVIDQPGLQFKAPPPLQNVVFLDKRIQSLDSPESKAIFTAEKKSLVIDWLVKWRITDPRQFIRNNGTDIRNAETRLSPIVQAALNEEVTRRNVQAVLSGEREKIMQGVIQRVSADAKSFGIEIVDMRIKRVDFVSNITESVYRRMQSERQRVANELRSTGQAEGEKIRADADRQREVIVAEAFREAQKVKGEGDAQGLRDLRRVLRSRSGLCPVLPQPRGVPRGLPQQERRHRGPPDNEFFKAMRGGRRRRAKICR